MAHFAKINEKNIVTEVLVIDQAEIDTGNWGDPAQWVQTSYNTRLGVYYTPARLRLTLTNPKPFAKIMLVMAWFGTQLVICFIGLNLFLRGLWMSKQVLGFAPCL